MKNEMQRGDQVIEGKLDVFQEAWLFEQIKPEIDPAYEWLD